MHIDLERLLKEQVSYLEACEITLPEDTLSALTSLFAQLSDAKRCLKETTNEHKGVSKHIGQRRKQGDDFSDLLTQQKQLKDTTKTLKANIKECEQSIEAIVITFNDVPWLPPQFSEQTPRIKPNGAITVKACDDAIAWDQFVNRHPNAVVYHTYAFKSLIEQVFGHTCHYLAAYDAEGDIIGVLPMVHLNSRLFGSYLVSIPFFNYAGVLAYHPEVEQALLVHAKKCMLTIEAEHIELRHCKPAEGNLACKNEKISMVLKLPNSVEALDTQLGTKVRAQIKRAAKFGTTFTVGSSELVDDFYTVFAINMRDLGTPVYSKQLFEAFLNMPNTHCIVGYHQGKPVCGGIVIEWRQSLEIPWASTLKSANKFDANMLMYKHLLDWAIQQGYQAFDFGRSSKDAPTYRFKKQWGAEPQELHWHYVLKEGQSLPELNPNNPKYALMIAAWKRMPVAISKLIGPKVVKYLP